MLFAALSCQLRRAALALTTLQVSDSRGWTLPQALRMLLSRTLRQWILQKGHPRMLFAALSCQLRRAALAATGPKVSDSRGWTLPQALRMLLSRTLRQWILQRG